MLKTYMADFIKKYILCTVMNIGLLTLAVFSPAYGASITLHVPILTDSPKLHLYFHELLKRSITDIGHTAKLVTQELPHLRIKHYLDSGRISIFWMVESSARNEQYTPIKMGLTNGLIGKRILLIRSGNQYKFNNTKTLEDFRKLNLLGGIGHKWFDVEVWKMNQLGYIEQHGNWRAIFNQVAAGRDYDYFSRGINEIVNEAPQYPGLSIEKNLVFIYNRDFRFYLSKQGEHAGTKYKDIIEKALEQAKKSGLIDKLVNKYWGRNLEKLDFKNRTKLYLKTPN